MTHADLTDGSDLDFAYDAAGRRLEKKYTKVINNVTYESKYTYHYIGSQITTIDISGKEDETITKNDQMRIHLGANSRPISFEYYTDIGSEQQASETYYYHYDLHGNVIRVTDDTGTTQITYTYDSLGTILTESNPNSIYNPFTWSGEAQVINDPEFDTSAASPKTGLYNSGSGYYNPETGTALSGTGAPATTNPTSASAEEPTAQSSLPASQLGLHAGIAAVAGGVPVSAAPATSTDVAPEPTTDTTPIIGIYGGDIELTAGMIWGFDSSAEQMRLTDTEESYKERVEHNREAFKRMREAEKRAEERQKREDDVKDGRTSDYPWDQPGWNADSCVGEIWRYKDLPQEIKNLIKKDYKTRNPNANLWTDKELDDFLNENLEWVAWGYLPKTFTDPDNSTGHIAQAGYYLMGYKLKGSVPHMFWGPGEATTTHAGIARVGTPFERGSTSLDGSMGPASAWALSWQGEIKTKYGLELFFMSMVGDVRLGVFGESSPSVNNAGNNTVNWDMEIVDFRGNSVIFPAQANGNLHASGTATQDGGGKWTYLTNNGPNAYPFDAYQPGYLLEYRYNTGRIRAFDSFYGGRYYDETSPEYQKLMKILGF